MIYLGHNVFPASVPLRHTKLSEPLFVVFTTSEFHLLRLYPPHNCQPKARCRLRLLRNSDIRTLDSQKPTESKIVLDTLEVPKVDSLLLYHLAK